MFGRGRNSGVVKWGLIGSAIAGGIALVPLVPVLKKRAMRATTILKKDHRMVSGLLMTLEMTPKFNGIVRKRLFDQIRNSVLMHAQVEEEIRKLAELKQNIEHHVEEEEGELFLLVTSRMSCQQLTEIGQRMHDRKAGLKPQMAA